METVRMKRIAVQSQYLLQKSGLPDDGITVVFR